MSEPLDAIQRAAQTQFSRQSERYAKGHILENVDDVRAALEHLVLPGVARVLDLATGAGHTGLHLASLGHEVCETAGLRVAHHELWSLKQPDLNWYFDTAGTPPENRQRVLELVASAPASARRLFQLSHEDGRIVWHWQQLTLIARR